MSTVIKLGSSRAVTAYADEATPPMPQAASTDPHREELDRLHGLLAERDAALADLKLAVETARRVGEAAGRAAAEQDAEDSRERALDLLGKGIQQAQQTLADGRERMEGLALLVARTALEKLFGDDRGRKAAISALVLRQLDLIERQMLLKIEVSRLDFPDPRELTALAEDIGADRALVSANADLPAGACRMQLRVGALDVGLDQQWGAVRALLDGLAEETAAQA